MPSRWGGCAAGRMIAPVRGRRNGAARVQKRPHPYQAKAEALDRAAMAASAADHHAGVVGDYIRITVFLAAVLGEPGHTRSRPSDALHPYSRSIESATFRLRDGCSASIWTATE
jgi:hypothetical protein